MDTQSIILELQAERDRLDNAINALRGNRRGPGRRKGMSTGRRGRRFLTASERKRISNAMRASWAKRRKAA